MAEHTDHAVVVGAGIGGLLAARALSESHAHVTLVERDVLGDSAGPRRGVGQGRHAHGLLARGREALEELFGGLTDELIALGAQTGDLQSGFQWVNDGRLMCQGVSGLLGVGVSRPLLESRVRARVLALPAVELADGCTATGLVATRDRRRVTGLRVQHRAGGGTGAEQVLDADLVVEATGRGSRGPRWLVELGHPAPEVEQVRIDLTYASRLYRRDPDALDGAAVGATVANHRGGVLIAQEDDRWVVSLGGVLGEACPLDDAGFTAYAGTLPAPVVHDVIRSAEPLTDAVRFRHPVSTRHHYERLPDHPAGHLVFGDAMASFNPAYGQGMTVAALQALVLRSVLRAGTHDLGGRFHRAASRVVDGAWDVSVGADLRFPAVQGRRTARVRAVNRYLQRLHVAAEHDPEVGTAFLRVVNLIDPPQRLLVPRTAARVLRGSRRGGSPPATRPAAVVRADVAR